MGKPPSPLPRLGLDGLPSGRTQPPVKREKKAAWSSLRGAGEPAESGEDVDVNVGMGIRQDLHDVSGGLC